MALGIRVAPGLTPDKAGALEDRKPAVQRRARDLAIVGERLLARETAMVGMIAIAEVPEHDFCGRLETALLDRPIGGGMAHDLPAISSLWLFQGMTSIAAAPHHSAASANARSLVG